MAYVEHGSQQGDSKKTETLRQYIARVATKADWRSSVKVVFKPNTYGGYSLVTDHKFRVEVREDNPLHGVISDNLEDWAKNNISLWVRVINPEKVSWSLVESTDDIAEWEEKPWGYTLTLRPPTPKKSPRQPKQDHPVEALVPTA